MKLRPFLLDQWIAGYAGAALPFNLAGSTGPPWTIDELLGLQPGSEGHLLAAPIAYQPSAGRSSLRDALAEMSGVPPEQIVVTAGASEALWQVFFLAAGPGANLVVPSPGFPAYDALPEALGFERRHYEVPSNGDAFDLEHIMSLVDSNTRIILVNTPHNPTGATISPQRMRALHDLAVSRGVQLISDEVFHPIYHGAPSQSAAALPHATVIGDLSKAFAMPGLRIGWIREPDPARRAQYVNAREYLSVSNTAAGEILAEIAVRHRDGVHARTQSTTSANLVRLESLMRDHSSLLNWTRPQGGTTAFVRFNTVSDTRPFCVAAATKGLLLVPGDCFGRPDHVRIGLGSTAPVVFANAMELFARLLSAVHHESVC